MIPEAPAGSGSIPRGHPRNAQKRRRVPILNTASKKATHQTYHTTPPLKKEGDAGIMSVVAQIIHSAVLSGSVTLHEVVGWFQHLTISRFRVLIYIVNHVLTNCKNFFTGKAYPDGAK